MYTYSLNAVVCRLFEISLDILWSQSLYLFADYSRYPWIYSFAWCISHCACSVDIFDHQPLFLFVDCTRYFWIYCGLSHRAILDLWQLEHLPDHTSAPLLRWPNAYLYAHMYVTTFVISAVCIVHFLEWIVALLPWCSSIHPSICLSGMDVYCDYTVHFSTDLSLWLDRPMLWAPWHQSIVVIV